MQFDPSSADPELPDLDDRLVEPGMPYEMYDGELVYVAPADEAHAARHAKVCAVVAAHVRPEFYVAAELLTRTSKVDDIAPDVSVVPRAPHPITGRRQLTHFVIEVVSKQRLAHAGRKAEKLVTRGVRRVFAIDVKRERALEWSAALGTWSVLDGTSVIEDAVLEAPLPLEALLSAARADDVVARALIRRRNPVIEATKAESRAKGRSEGKRQGKREGRAEGKREGRAEGRVDGMRESLLALLEVRGIALDARALARIDAEADPEQLCRWLARAARCAHVRELFVEP